MRFNPTDHPEFSVFFTKCTAELHATKWYDVAKVDKLAVMSRLAFAAASCRADADSRRAPKASLIEGTT